MPAANDELPEACGAMLTVKQVAARLGCSVGCVYSLVSAGKIAHVRVGIRRGAIRIPKESFAEFLDGASVPVRGPERLKRSRYCRPSNFKHLNGERLRVAWTRQGALSGQPNANSAPSSESRCDREELPTS